MDFLLNPIKTHGFPSKSHVFQGLLSWYREIIEKKQLRVLIYNGDADPGWGAEIRSWRLIPT